VALIVVHDFVTTLSGAITDSATSLVATANFPAAYASSAADPIAIRIDDEIIHVVANPSTTWTIERGKEGTTAAAHSDAATIGAVASRDTLISLSIRRSLNAIINGNFDFWQRGTSFATIADGAYFADCWSYHKVGAMVHTVSRSTTVPTVGGDTPLSNYSALVDCTTVDASIAATDYCYLMQTIEGDDWKGYAQRPFVLGFWFRSPKTGIHCVAVQNSGRDRSYVAEFTVAAANTFEFKSVAIPASPSGGTWNYTNGVGLRVVFPLVAGTDRQGAAGSWNSADDIATSNQQNLADNVANDAYISQVFLLPGEAAGAMFPPYSIEAEYARCQRRYEIIGGGLVPTFQGYAGTGTPLTTNIPFSVRKGGTPTVTKNGTWNATSVSAQPAVDGASPWGCRLTATKDGTSGGFVVEVGLGDATDFISAEWNP
jgi:hypothetical protein